MYCIGGRSLDTMPISSSSDTMLWYEDSHPIICIFITFDITILHYKDARTADIYLH